MELTIIISIAGLALSALTATVGYKSGIKKEGQNSGVLMSDVGYIKAGVDDLKREQKDTAKLISEIDRRVTRVEESTKQAHKRIDTMEKE